MSEIRARVNASMAALIDGSFGCLDAAAETINARLGRSVGKGTLSKKLGQSIGWNVDEVIALEDAAGRYPVTKMLARRLRPNEYTAQGSVLLHVGQISKETGEAVNAILSAQQSDAGCDYDQAIVEIDEAIEALRQARARLEREYGGSEK
ncbi:hypothetical protein MHM39_14985 [Phaeobacter sp. CNT1-3]|nr:hypothetical protein [Phaeobacter sp. CNT1-3]